MTGWKLLFLIIMALVLVVSAVGSAYYTVQTRRAADAIVAIHHRLANSRVEFRIGRDVVLSTTVAELVSVAAFGEPTEPDGMGVDVLSIQGGHTRVGGAVPVHLVVTPV